MDREGSIKGFWIDECRVGKLRDWHGNFCVHKWKNGRYFGKAYVVRLRMREKLEVGRAVEEAENSDFAGAVNRAQRIKERSSRVGRQLER